MKIVLKNGESLNLEVSSLILEYIEEYEGGIEKLKKDARGEKDENGYTRSMYVTNHLLYSIVASNYDKELTYRQAIRLVKLEDIEKIIRFIASDVENSELKEVASMVSSKHRI